MGTRATIANYEKRKFSLLCGCICQFQARLVNLPLGEGCLLPANALLHFENLGCDRRITHKFHFVLQVRGASEEFGLIVNDVCKSGIRQQIGNATDRPAPAAIRSPHN
jgi:hypothetical protein